MLANAPIVTVLPATDIERARAFYEDTLGLRRLPSDVPDALFFEAGAGTLLHIYKRDTPTKAEHTVAGFWVDDVEQEVAELERKGVHMEQYDLPQMGIKTDEHGVASFEDGEKSAWFTDPEGNIIAIVGGVMVKGRRMGESQHAEPVGY